ncbi:WD40 repeat-like protein, partial [Coprinopsis sp. MPI-PUGE-AT-0042]
EIDNLVQELGLVKKQRDEFEGKVHSQVNELNIIRQALYDLETQHGKVRQRFEEELGRVREELRVVRSGDEPSSRPSTSSNSLKPPGDPSQGSGVGQKRPLSSPSASASTASFRPPGPPGFAGLGPMAATPKLPPVPGKEATADTSPFRATSMVPAPPDSRESKPPNMAYYRSSTAFLERITERGLIFPDDYSGDMASLPGEYRKEGLDWYAMFNPRMKSKGGLDVDLVHTLIHESVVCCVRFSHDGKYLATGCNRTVQIYDTRTGQKTCVLMDDSVSRQGDLYIRSVCFSPDGALLATGAEDKIVRVWDIGKRRIHAAFDGHQQEIYSLEFSFDGRLVVSGSGDKTVRIWDLVTNDCTVLTISDIVPAPNANSQDAGVTSVGISPDARFVAAGSLDHAVRVWEFLRTGTLVERLRGHGDSVYSVAFTPDGRGLVSGSLDRTIRTGTFHTSVSWVPPGKPMVPLQSNKELNHPGYIGLALCTKVFAGHKDYVLSVSVSGDGQWVVSGSKDRAARTEKGGRMIAPVFCRATKNSVISIDLSPAGGLLATGSGDWQARICEFCSECLL